MADYNSGTHLTRDEMAESLQSGNGVMMGSTILSKNIHKWLQPTYHFRHIDRKQRNIVISLSVSQHPFQHTPSAWHQTHLRPWPWKITPRRHHGRLRLILNVHPLIFWNSMKFQKKRCFAKIVKDLFFPHGRFIFFPLFPSPNSLSRYLFLLFTVRGVLIIYLFLVRDF